MSFSVFLVTATSWRWQLVLNSQSNCAYIYNLIKTSQSLKILLYLKFISRHVFLSIFSTSSSLKMTSFNNWFWIHKPIEPIWHWPVIMSDSHWSSLFSGNYFLNRDDTAMVDYGFIDAPKPSTKNGNGNAQTAATKDSNGSHNTNNYSRGNEY